MPPRTPLNRRQKITLVVFFGMLAFAVAFITLATWLGRQDRRGFRHEPDPPLVGADKLRAEALGTRLPIPRRASGVAGSAGLETAIAALGRGDATAALEALGDVAPDDAVLILVRGIARERLGDLDAAERDYAAATAADPLSAEAPLKLAKLRIARGRARDAVDPAEIAARLAPGCADAHYALGQACLAIRDSGRAKRAFQDVLLLRPGDANAARAVKIIDGS